jgi:hypothetical protein
MGTHCCNQPVRKGAAAYDLDSARVQEQNLDAKVPRVVIDQKVTVNVTTTFENNFTMDKGKVKMAEPPQAFYHSSVAPDIVPESDRTDKKPRNLRQILVESEKNVDYQDGLKEEVKNEPQNMLRQLATLRASTQSKAAPDMKLIPDPKPNVTSEPKPEPNALLTPTLELPPGSKQPTTSISHFPTESRGKSPVNDVSKEGSKTDLPCAFKPCPMTVNENARVGGMKSIMVSPDSLICERKGILADTYEIIAELGEGSFGKVQRVREKKLNGQIRAMKVISKAKCQMSENYVEEIKILQQLVRLPITAIESS